MTTTVNGVAKLLSGVFSDAYVIRNAGTVNVYIGQDSSLSAAYRAFTITPGGTVTWDGKSELWAVTDGKTCDVEVVYSGNFASNPGPDHVTATIEGPVEATVTGKVDATLTGPVNATILGPIDVDIINSVVNVGGTVKIDNTSGLLARVTSLNLLTASRGNGSVQVELGDISAYTSIDVEINALTTDSPITREYQVTVVQFDSDAVEYVTSRTVRMLSSGLLRFRTDAIGSNAYLDIQGPFASNMRVHVVVLGMRKPTSEFYYHSPNRAITGSWVSELGLNLGSSPYDKDFVVNGSQSVAGNPGNCYIAHYAGRAWVSDALLGTNNATASYQILAISSSTRRYLRRVVLPETGNSEIPGGELILPERPLSVTLLGSSSTLPALALTITYE